MAEQHAVLFALQLHALPTVALLIDDGDDDDDGDGGVDGDDESPAIYMRKNLKRQRGHARKKPCNKYISHNNKNPIPAQLR